MTIWQDHSIQTFPSSSSGPSIDLLFSAVHWPVVVLMLCVRGVLREMNGILTGLPVKNSDENMNLSPIFLWKLTRL